MDLTATAPATTCRWCAQPIRRITLDDRTTWVHAGPGGAFPCRDPLCGMCLPTQATPASEADAAPSPTARHITGRHHYPTGAGRRRYPRPTVPVPAPRRPFQPAVTPQSAPHRPLRPAAVAPADPPLARTLVALRRPPASVPAPLSSTPPAPVVALRPARSVPAHSVPTRAEQRLDPVRRGLRTLLRRRPTRQHSRQRLAGLTLAA